MSALPGKPASNSSKAESGYDKILAVPPGERLQKARKAHNLDVKEVADKLNLSPGVVRALEADDYRMLPNATFVKGYLRSYARVLDISSDDLVRAYEALTGCNQPVKIEPIAAPMIRDSGNGLKYGVVALLLAGLLAVVLWVWPDSAQKDGQAVRAAITDPASLAGNGEHDASQIPRPIQPAVITSPVVVRETESLPQPAEQAEPDDEPQPAEALQETNPASADAPSSNEMPLNQTPQLAAEATQSAAAEPVVRGALSMAFSDDCWVEVRDRTGELVFSSLKRAGDEVTLNLAAPLNVKLGNGDVVTVRYNNQPVSYTTSPNRKVVRLTLGE